MIKRIIIILIIVIFLILIGFISAFLYVFGDQKEYEIITNYKNSEQIYLIKTTWGINDSRMAIGLDKRLKGGFANRYPDKYESVGSGDFPILYKLANDTLYIYDSYFSKPMDNRFKTIIKLIELNPDDRIEIRKNYKKMGLKIFPESQTY